jgi:hypothetical protein
MKTKNLSSENETAKGINPLLPVFIVKGYKLSQDYGVLWRLIQDGHCVVGWVLKSTEYKEPIYDVVEIKMNKNTKEYMMGTRGIGYEGFKNTLSDFKGNCKYWSLSFIVPDNCR